MVEEVCATRNNHVPVPAAKHATCRWPSFLSTQGAEGGDQAAASAKPDEEMLQPAPDSRDTT